MAGMSPRNRPGFSLLEMVLALAIGMLLLAALYQTLLSQVQFSQIGRDAISEAEMARSVLTRISDDIANQMGVLDPRVLPKYEQPEVPDTTDATTTTTTTSSAAMTGTPATSTASSGVVVNVVRGDGTRLTLATYRVQPAQAAGDEIVSDVRRVSYWLVNNGDQPLGLARHETRRATAAEIDSSPSDLPDQQKYVIAKEIKAITFEYHDGKTWQQTWEGTSLGGPELNIPQGPPAAIAIKITLMPGVRDAAEPSATATDSGTTYRLVVAIPAANNFPTIQTQTPP